MIGGGGDSSWDAADLRVVLFFVTVVFFVVVMGDVEAAVAAFSEGLRVRGAMPEGEEDDPEG